MTDNNCNGFEPLTLVDEPERAPIYKWKKKREKKFSKFMIDLKIHAFTWQMMKMFLQGFNYVVILNMALTGGVAFLCMRYKVAYGFIGLVINSPVAFVLAFLIRNDFVRREKALATLSTFRSHVFILFLLFRELNDVLETKVPTGVHFNKLFQFVTHVREYLNTRNKKKRKSILKIIYADYSDITHLIEHYTIIDQPTNSSMINRMHYFSEYTMVSFEKLRNIREYTLPNTIRSFTKIYSFVLPPLLVPMWMGYAVSCNTCKLWPVILLATTHSFIFTYLQGIEDRLAEPFLNIMHGDIDLGTLVEWARNVLLHNVDRKYHLKQNFTLGVNFHNEATKTIENVINNNKNAFHEVYQKRNTVRCYIPNSS